MSEIQSDGSVTMSTLEQFWYLEEELNELDQESRQNFCSNHPEIYEGDDMSPEEFTKAVDENILDELKQLIDEALTRAEALAAQ
jgi:hypothetical protein